MKILKTLLIVPLAGLLSMPVYARGIHHDDNYSRIDNRFERQHSRIRQGVKSGELTKYEAKKLKVQQKQISGLAQKLSRDGSLSRHDKQRLKRRQDAASKKIASLKHNDNYQRGHHHYRGHDRYHHAKGHYLSGYSRLKSGRQALKGFSVHNHCDNCRSIAQNR